MSEVITVNKIKFHIQRSTRRKTIAVAVGRDYRVVIYAPENAKREHLAEIANRRSLWVYQKLQSKLSYPQHTLPKEFVDGEGFFYFGRSYRLRIVQTQPKSKLPKIRLRGLWFELRNDAVENADQYFRQWYEENGLPWIERHVEFYSKRIGAKPNKIQIRQLGNRWASCSKTGNINFNWQIMRFPPGVIDYIIAHELVHMIQPNHDKNFWQILERAMPDYAKRKKWLDENGGRF